MKGRIEALDDMGPLTRVKMDNSLVALITKQSRESPPLKKRKTFISSGMYLHIGDVK